jgi:hypothetical protein
LAMASEERFPQFVRLPPELQAMVWEFARRSHRHIFQIYFKRFDVPKRIYECIDARTGYQMRRLTTARAPDIHNPQHPADGVSAEKHRFNGRVYEVRDVHGMHRHQSFDQARVHLAGYPTFAWMNFEHDVFAFRKDYGGDDWRREPYMGFIARHIHSTFSPPDSHWFFKVEKLALLFGGSINGDLECYDWSVLGRTHALKVVYIVVERSWDCPHDKAGHLVKAESNDDGFILYSDWVREHTMLNDKDEHPGAGNVEKQSCSCNLSNQHCRTFVWMLTGLFKRTSNQPRLEVVVEKRMRW